jgi:hypothetical protein
VGALGQDGPTGNLLDAPRIPGCDRGSKGLGVINVVCDAAKE